MSDAFRREMQALLGRRKAEGETQRKIADAAGVRQPLVSLAMKGKLVGKTRNVDKLFEYLKAVSPDAGGSAEHVPEERDLDPRLLKAVARLSDGSAEGDARLIGLLEAIAAMRSVGKTR